jgi:hypothetical protein
MFDQVTIPTAASVRSHRIEFLRHDGGTLLSVAVYIVPGRVGLFVAVGDREWALSWPRVVAEVPASFARADAARVARLERW